MFWCFLQRFVYKSLTTKKFDAPSSSLFLGQHCVGNRMRKIEIKHRNDLNFYFMVTFLFSSRASFLEVNYMLKTFQSSSYKSNKTFFWPIYEAFPKNYHSKKGLVVTPARAETIGIDLHSTFLVFSSLSLESRVSESTKKVLLLVWGI